MTIQAHFYRHHKKYITTHETVKDAANDLFWLNDTGEGWAEKITDNDIVIWENDRNGNTIDLEKLAELSNV